MSDAAPARRKSGPGLKTLLVAAACRELASELKVEIDFHQDGSADGLPNHVALEMLRVLEEALHNAAVNGRISLQSYPGVGTTVRACVPR